jgi:hypothetical protein
MPIRNALGQTRVGIRTTIPTQSTLMTGIYSVYNSEATITTLGTGVYAAYNAETTVFYL